MQLYSIVYRYVVKANSRYEAKVIFSRLLEEGKEQHYLYDTFVGEFSEPKKTQSQSSDNTGWVGSLLNQLFGSGSPKRKKY